MASFYVTARKTSPITPVTVEAESRELAIQQVLDTKGEGEEIEVLQCTEVLAEPPTAPVTASKAEKK
jgi:hypothetical protein